MLVGFIKIHRKLIDWEWYSDVNTCRLFLHLLLTAKFKDEKWRGVDIKRGQVLTGRTSLAKSTSLTESQVRTAISKLKSTNEISIKITSEFSIITLTNYDLYQSKSEINDQQDDQQTAEEIANESPANRQLIATDKEIQEEQELKKKLLKSQFEKIYKIYNQGKNIKVIPFEKLKAKFQNCLKEITFEELEQNIKDYLQYLSTAEWRKKKAFDAWINSPEFYANDWINEGSDKKAKTTTDSFCQSLNKLLEQDLIEKLIENQDAVTIKLFSASSYDKWEVIDSGTKNKIKELLNAKFNKKITIKF